MHWHLDVKEKKWRYKEQESAMVKFSSLESRTSKTFNKGLDPRPKHNKQNREEKSKVKNEGILDMN